MKKFNFRLESVLNYREILQKQQERRLGEAGQQLNASRDELAQLRATLTETYRSPDPSGVIDVTTVMLSEQYRERLAADIETQREAVAALQVQFNEQRIVLTKAMQDKQALVTLKDKALAEFREELEKEQQNLIDELSTLRNGADKRM